MTFAQILTILAAAFMVAALVIGIIASCVDRADQSLDEWADEAAYGDHVAVPTFRESTILDFARPAGVRHNAHDGGADASSFHDAPVTGKAR